MGYLDKLRDKATGVARTRGESIGATVDKAATVINRRTGGKHADKVSRFAEQAKRKVDEFGQAPPGATRDQEEGPPPAGPPIL
jgi:hypothetical protein